MISHSSFSINVQRMSLTMQKDGHPLQRAADLVEYVGRTRDSNIFDDNLHPIVDIKHIWLLTLPIVIILIFLELFLFLSITLYSLFRSLTFMALFMALLLFLRYCCEKRKLKTLRYCYEKRKLKTV